MRSNFKRNTFAFSSLRLVNTKILKKLYTHNRGTRISECKLFRKASSAKLKRKQLRTGFEPISLGPFSKTII